MCIINKIATNMKKILLAFLILPLWLTTVRAQSSPEYSLIGGVNFAYFNQVPPLTDAVSSLGYMLGIRASIGSNVFLEPAIEFASYGSSITLDATNEFESGTTHQMRANYIRVPVQVGAKIFEDAPLNIEVRAGLAESFLVGLTDQVTTGTGQAFTTNDLNSLRTGAIIGGGVRLFFLKLDLEYEWALTDYFKNINSPKQSALYIILGGNF
jgi:hypothetical protein